MKKYFIFGITGLIGKCFAQTATDAFVVGHGSKVDICHHQLVIDKLCEYKPEVIFFCANNLGGVDRCEKDPEFAIKFHFEAVKNIVNYCLQNTKPLVFLSTTYVFGETPSSPPMSHYGRAKLQAEKYITNKLTSYLIIRTVNVYGEDKTSKTPNFYQQVLNHMEESKVFLAAENIYSYPTPVEILVQKTLALLNKQEWGIHLIAGEEEISRFDWAKKISNNNSLIKSFHGTCSYRPQKQIFTNKT